METYATWDPGKGIGEIIAFSILWCNIRQNIDHKIPTLNPQTENSIEKKKKKKKKSSDIQWMLQLHKCVL